MKGLFPDKVSVLRLSALNFSIIMALAGFKMSNSIHPGHLLVPSQFFQQPMVLQVMTLFVVLLFYVSIFR